MKSLQSHYEGLALPIWIAIAGGVPVESSHTEPLIEIAANAALFVNHLLLLRCYEGYFIHFYGRRDG